jgi:hypothetical protein
VRSRRFVPVQYTLGCEFLTTLPRFGFPGFPPVCSLISQQRGGTSIPCVLR